MEKEKKQTPEQELAQDFKEFAVNLKKRIEELKDSSRESVIAEDSGLGLKVVMESSRFDANQLLNQALQGVEILRKARENKTLSPSGVG